MNNMTASNKQEVRRCSTQVVGTAALACIGCFLLITWICDYISGSLVFDGAAKWLLFGLIPVLGSFTVLYFSHIPALRSFLISCLILVAMWILYLVLACILVLLDRNRQDSPYEWEHQKHVTYRPKSPEQTPVGACSSAVAVHAASRRWLSYIHENSNN